MSRLQRKMKSTHLIEACMKDALLCEFALRSYKWCCLFALQQLH